MKNGSPNPITAKHVDLTEEPAAMDELAALEFLLERLKNTKTHRD